MSPTRALQTTVQFSRTTPFVPLDQPVLLPANDGDYLPVRMLSYHHIVNDTVAGQPVLITY